MKQHPFWFVWVREPGQSKWNLFYKIDTQEVSAGLALAFCIGKLIDGSDVSALKIERIIITVPQ